MGLLEWLALAGSVAGLLAWFHALDHARVGELRDVRQDHAVLAQRVDDEVRRCDGLAERLAERETDAALLRREIEILRGTVEHNRNNCKNGGELVVGELKLLDEKLDAIERRLPRPRN